MEFIFGLVSSSLLNIVCSNVLSRSLLKFSLAVSLFTLTLIYLGYFLLFFSMFITIKQGRWSDIFVIIIPDFTTFIFATSLQNIWSIRVALCLVNLVGSVMQGWALCEVSKSKYSWHFVQFSSLRRFMFESPHIVSTEFSFAS